jgi:beta-N-acetylhexosaminidase
MTIHNVPPGGSGEKRWYSSPAPLMPPVPPRGKPPHSRLRPRRSQWGLHVAITLLVLAVLILVGSLVGQRLLDNTSSIHPLTPGTNQQVGAFQRPPLNAQQIDDLKRLSAHMHYKQLASLYVARMSLDELLGQLIMVEYDDEYYSADLDTMVNKLHAGGVIMYEFQMKSFAQTKRDIAEMQQHAKLPLLISTDEEGGIVHRLTHIYPPRPSALSIYQTGDPNVAADEGHRVARELKALGINVNLAPNVDVALVPGGPGQVTRTYGYTAESVIKFASPYLKAMQGDGVIGCIKHFPGMGASDIDPHDGLPVVRRSKQQIYDVELAPFKYFIQSKEKLENPGMIMPTDVLMPAIDPVMPAELSHTFMTDILRKEFGYDGVVLTDALYMKGVLINGKQISMAEAAVLALNAGNDMLLGPTGTYQMQDMLNGLKEAVKSGRIPMARIYEAATRIIALKMEWHLMPAVPPLH